jgi:hypothetical protein
MAYGVAVLHGAGRWLVAYPGIIFEGGFTPGIISEWGCSTNSVENRGQIDRESGDGSPQSGVPLNLQMNETCILIRLLRMYIAHNWEFG